MRRKLLWTAALTVLLLALWAACAPFDPEASGVVDAMTLAEGEPRCYAVDARGRRQQIAPFASDCEVWRVSVGCVESYRVLEGNAGMASPHNLYWYDPSRQGLVHVARFSSEWVTGIRVRDLSALAERPVVRLPQEGASLSAPGRIHITWPGGFLLQQTESGVDLMGPGGARGLRGDGVPFGGVLRCKGDAARMHPRGGRAMLADRPDKRRLHGLCGAGGAARALPRRL